MMLAARTFIARSLQVKVFIVKPVHRSLFWCQSLPLEYGTLLRPKKAKRNIRSINSSVTQYGLREPKKSFGFMGWFLLFVPLTTFCLGTWQVKRRKWKLELMESMYQKTTAQPVDLPEELSELTALEYCPVKVRGRFIHSQEILLGPRSLLIHGDASSQGGLISPRTQNSGGQSGCLVITPFKLSDQNKTILVQRGWVSNTHKDSNVRKEGQVAGELEIVGIVRLSEQRAPFVPENKSGSKYWYYRDVESMANELDTDPVFLDAVVDTTVPGGPIGGQTRITLRNEHLSYILTWYSLSAATAYMWYRYFILKLPLK